MAEGETVYCSNCCQRIEKSKFFLHERMCTTNVKKCPKCNKPFTVEDIEEHMIKEHSEVICELCKRKFNIKEYENHKNNCDCRMVPCKYCELEFLYKELKEHQITCGSKTEQCPRCGQYIQKKDFESHQLYSCHSSQFQQPIKPNQPKIKNNDEIEEEFLGIKENQNKYNNFFNTNQKNDIKIKNNDNKPNIPFNQPLVTKVIKEKNNTNSNHVSIPYSNNFTNNNNNLIKSNNFINSSNNKEPVKPKINQNLYNNNINVKNKQPQGKTNNVNIGLNNKNKNPTVLKRNVNASTGSKRYEGNNNNKDNLGRKMSKPNFANNRSKVSMNSQKASKNEEEFRKSREKFVFKPQINTKTQMKNNKNNIPKNNNNKSNNQAIKKNDTNNTRPPQPKIIDDNDYNDFDFGEVEDDSFMQEIIQRSLKEH